MRKYRISVANPKEAGRGRGLIHVRNPGGSDRAGRRKRDRAGARLNLARFRPGAWVTKLSRGHKGFRPILSEMSRKNGTFRRRVLNDGSQGIGPIGESKHAESALRLARALPLEKLFSVRRS
jgi:hypothetical protein